MVYIKLKCRKISKSRLDLDLGLTMPNIELFPVIFHVITAYLNILFLDQFLLELSCKRKNTHTQKHTHTDTHKDSDKNLYLRFAKTKL